MKKLVFAAALAAVSMPALADFTRYNITVTASTGKGHLFSKWCDNPMCDDGLAGIKIAVDNSIVNDLKLNALPAVGVLQFGGGEAAPTHGSCIYGEDTLICDLRYLAASVEVTLNLASKATSPGNIIVTSDFHSPHIAEGLISWNRVTPPKPKKKKDDSAPVSNNPPGT
ncbi:MAG: hypothetical protein F4234_11520 [Gammaproteobacteria bacterium]|nr:hypothetical protein [Gammaproteobacteria bacterium]